MAYDEDDKVLYPDIRLEFVYEDLYFYNAEN